MDQKAIQFLHKKKIKPDNILYFCRADRKTTIYLADGQVVTTYIPVKHLLSSLPKGAFLNITKGVVISASKIEQIEGNRYLMQDGREFTGRVRGSGEHKLNRKQLDKHIFPSVRISSETIHQQFAIMDASPLAVCVFEVVYNTAGHSVDFVFRYCNKAMAKFQGYPQEVLMDHSFYDIFPDAHHKWLDIYSDVAINGTSHIIEENDAERNIRMTVYCHQPSEGFCVCCIASNILGHRL